MNKFNIFIFGTSIFAVVFGTITKTSEHNKINQNYILTYFDAPAVGEALRFLLSYGNLDWVDKRIQLRQWVNLKHTMPFGQMPSLEYDGKLAHQSVAIARYLAKQVNLTGNNDWENLEIDAAVDTITDLRLVLVAYKYEKDPIIKENKKGPLFNVTLPFYLERLEAQAKRNRGYLAAEKLTWADLFFVSFLDYFNWLVNKDIIAEAPTLKKLNQTVCEIPNIKAWIQSRPPVNFNMFSL
ncbi:unnamed protein product [Psylliodes chrysocephalus]|uniref:glutathione transferase n=1 Tax=Psylliodes chrysocephalus TaxID=3402493 RepID=A0A9P0GD39_9CUCU|nr:unnamed protein product [Psylliodes chrysocephala]